MAPLQPLFLRMAFKVNIPLIGLSSRDITNNGVSARDMTKVGKTLTGFFYTALETSVWSLSSDSRVHGRRRGYMTTASNTGLATIFGNMVRHAASPLSWFRDTALSSLEIS